MGYIQAYPPTVHAGIPWIVQGFELLSRVQGMGPFVQGFLMQKKAKDQYNFSSLGRFILIFNLPFQRFAKLFGAFDTMIKLP